MTNKQTILIVDDSASDLQIIESSLKNEYNITKASSGNECLELLKSNELPDLILLDILMPELDGYETCKHIKKDKRTEHIPIIFITALNEEENEYVGISLGAVDYITKPFNQKIIHARIKNHMSGLLQAELIKEQYHYTNQMESFNRLTSGLAHDFNNLLSLISGYTFLSESLTHHDGVKLKGYIDNIKSASSYAGDLVAQMLIFSQKGNEKLTRCSLEDSLNDVLESLSYELSANINVEMDIQESEEVSASKIQLHQMVKNIILNSINSMSNGGRINITLNKQNKSGQSCDSCHEVFEGDYVELKVVDTGAGIEHSRLKSIFEPYYTTRKLDSVKGTGMGLAVVHGIVHKLNGHINVETEIDVGTKLTILLPLINID